MNLGLSLSHGSPGCRAWDDGPQIAKRAGRHLPGLERKTATKKEVLALQTSVSLQDIRALLERACRVCRGHLEV